ncbi:MAG: transglutaminase domain-containing protein [Clostridiales bacterium]|nr:transglutaminase domain-containing protein [Clostridiales bacterium]
MPSKVKKQKWIASPPDRVTCILAYILTLALSVGLTLMFTSTYDMEINYQILIPGMALFTMLAVFVGKLKKSFPFYIALGASAFIGGLFWYFNLFDVRKAYEYVMSTLTVCTFHSLDMNYFVSAASLESHSLSLLYLFLSFIPILVIAWVILKRKTVLFVLLVSFPYILCSIALDYMFPSMLSCELVIGSMILLVLFHNIRKTDGGQKDQTILKLVIPVFALLFIIGRIYPLDSYDKNTVAEEQKQLVFSLAEKAYGLRDKVPKSVFDLFKKEQTSDSWMGNTTIKSLASKIATMKQGSEDLSMAGSYDPPAIELFKITRYRNSEYIGPVTDSRYLYLKFSAMSMYDENEWSSAKSGVAAQEYYMNGILPDLAESKYILKVSMVASTDCSVVPYYTDNCLGSGSVSSGLDKLPLYRTAILNERGVGDLGDDYYYAYNNVPVKVGEDSWSDWYLKKIYDECLDVPQETREGILNCDAIPSWYRELVEDPDSMSLEEKVNRVCSFVSTLHPYDSKTGYPPSNKDFVVWFIDDAESGFCVHYATTAAILLRMVNVPTRYVNGYMINTLRDNEEMFVYANDAHAWIEFFDPEYGWLLYDPTPGNGNAMKDFSMDQAHQEAFEGRGSSDTRETTSMTETTSATETGRTPTTGNDASRINQITKEIKDSKNSEFKLPKVVVILLSVAAVVLLLFCLRAVYCFIWRKKLLSGTFSERTRAYYRYFSRSMAVYGKTPSRKIRAIGEKAAFSASGVMEEDWKKIISLGEQALKEEGEKNSKFKRFLSRYILQVNFQDNKD